MSRNFISAKDLSREDVLAIFKRADEFSTSRVVPTRVNLSHLGGLLFFEPSTRTRIGFEAAAWKLGINTVVMNETKQTESMSQSESMADTIRTLNAHVSFYCIRHPSEKIFDQIIPYTQHAVINGGNGYQEHPTQALIDTYTMWLRFGSLDGLTITLIGEIAYARAVHSMLILLANFSGVTINELTPLQLKLQDNYKNLFEVNGNRYCRLNKPSWGKEQVLYSTGFPPKNPSGTFLEPLRSKYKITRAIASKLAPDCIILDALPRIDEIDQEVDSLPAAYYFKQNELSLYVRMAIIDYFCL